MIDMNAVYSRLAAADEACDEAALAALAWQMYSLLAITSADLDALRARFRVYVTSPHARAGPQLAPRAANAAACAAAA